jgi:hypothetical protein
MSEQKCPICNSIVAESARYPKYVCSDCWSRAVDENGRPLAFGYSPDDGYCVWYADTLEPRQTGICFIDGVRCWAGEDYWGGSVVAYPYDGEK